VGKIDAYIFIEVEIGKSEHVLNELRKLDIVKSVAFVTGIFDVIVRVSVNNLEELYEATVNYIHKIDGVKRTRTHIIEKELKQEG